MISGIIFDFDGVIVDSEPIYIRSLIRYLKTLGVDTSEEEISYTIGQHVKDIASDIVSQFDLKMSIDEFVTESGAFYRNESKDVDYPILEGVKELIEDCKRKGIKMAVASSSSYEYVTRVLRRYELLDYFEFVLSGKDLKHSKPDPEIYNIAIKRLGIAKDKLIIIEDSSHGVRAGKASGVYTIAYKGAKFVQDTSFADLEIKDYKQLKI